jgi:hypothetical protein
VSRQNVVHSFVYRRILEKNLLRGRLSVSERPHLLDRVTVADLAERLDHGNPQVIL